jgi:hypothetical protein
MLQKFFCEHVPGEPSAQVILPVIRSMVTVPDLLSSNRIVFFVIVAGDGFPKGKQCMPPRSHSSQTLLFEKSTVKICCSPLTLQFSVIVFARAGLAMNKMARAVAIIMVRMISSPELGWPENPVGAKDDAHVLQSLPI